MRARRNEAHGQWGDPFPDDSPWVGNTRGPGIARVVAPEPANCSRGMARQEEWARFPEPAGYVR